MSSGKLIVAIPLVAAFMTVSATLWNGHMNRKANVVTLQSSVLTAPTENSEDSSSNDQTSQYDSNREAAKRTSPVSDTSEQIKGDDLDSLELIKGYDARSIIACNDAFRVDVQKSGSGASGKVFLKPNSRQRDSFEVTFEWLNISRDCALRLVKVGRDPSFYASFEIGLSNAQ